ncbi:unnamed protein product [Schistosoma rodhaini]|uniref:Saposin B-type domain-containing protein n=2 Tax=Schistosoma rodhaini TaxID=6188 RepID=A0AA85FGK4_9TREM|nr:unnamed protein product [Schistosoma rodhaini]
MMLITVLFIFCIFYPTSDAFKVSTVEENDYEMQNVTLECRLCLSGLSLAHYFMDDMYWRDIYMMGAKKLCTFISSEQIKNICNKYTSKYLPKILDEVGSLIGPGICTDFDACKSTEVKLFTIQENNKI